MVPEVRLEKQEQVRRKQNWQAAASKLFDQLPPFNAEAEMSLLGSMILDSDVIGDVIGLVPNGEYFYEMRHTHVFDALLYVYDKTSTVDLVQLQAVLRDRKVFDDLGAGDYLISLAEAVPSALNAKYYAEIVAQKYKLRRLIEISGQSIYDAHHSADFVGGANEVLDKAEQELFELAHAVQTQESYELSDILEKELERIDSPQGMLGIPSGYFDLDEILLGFQPGDLVILAARPSMGKTALALNLAEQIAIGGVPVPGAPPTRSAPVVFFSLEMGKSSIAQRMLSARSGVNGEKLRSGKHIPDEDLRRLISAASDLKAASIYIDDTPSMSVLQLRARARRLVKRHGVKAIMIDYLQLMTAPGAAKDGRQNEVSTVSRGIKALARELNVPVICLAQLNRGPADRESSGFRPRMSDLRESGSIEQDADVILLLHREEYYHVGEDDWAASNPERVGIAELIIAKQRNGPTGTVSLKWNNNTTRFENYDVHARAPGSNHGFHEPKPSSTGHSPAGYSSPSAAAAGFGQVQGVEAPPFASPFESAPKGLSQPSTSFAPGKKTGPIESHRDGGGPDEGYDLDIPV